MPGKRFRARRHYSSTRIWLLSAAMLVLGGSGLYALTGHRVFPEVAGAIALGGLAIALWSDRKDRIVYSVEGFQLTMRRGRIVERLDLTTIQDASLVDRRAARDLLQERIRTMEERGMIQAERDEFQRQFTRWCTVRIGLGPLSFGGDRRDRRPDGKYDLILVRLRTGRSLLLSPVHNQDLVAALDRNRHQDQQHQHRA
jgi:hypothetical protein